MQFNLLQFEIKLYPCSGSSHHISLNGYKWLSDLKFGLVTSWELRVLYCIGESKCLNQILKKRIINK